MKYGTALLYLIGLLFSSQAGASDKEGFYWVYGIGQESCADYREARLAAGPAELKYRNWIEGYLTAVNRSAVDTYNLLENGDFNAALAWLDRYCLKFPDNRLYMAMANMAAVLYPDRQSRKQTESR